MKFFVEIRLIDIISLILLAIAIAIPVIQTRNKKKRMEQGKFTKYEIQTYKEVKNYYDKTKVKPTFEEWEESQKP